LSFEQALFRIKTWAGDDKARITEYAIKSVCRWEFKNRVEQFPEKTICDIRQFISEIDDNQKPGFSKTTNSSYVPVGDGFPVICFREKDLHLSPFFKIRDTSSRSTTVLHYMLSDIGLFRQNRKLELSKSPQTTISTRNLRSRDERSGSLQVS
jgi:hypothetical protein